MDDQFQNLDNWNHEVQMNGFGYVPLTRTPSVAIANNPQYWFL